MQVNITLKIQSDTQLYYWIILKVYNAWNTRMRCNSFRRVETYFVLLNIPFVNIWINNVIFFLLLVQQLRVGHGLIIRKVSR